ncbi:hypothetical protein GCM10009096_17220 [Parasphingorhabdus litoris]|uniref:ABM domain-containing protein n=1 Tax=Parasphingorhabdus litoris TaxID=394733 RepID=A0ABN1AGM1_9SPHN|nr:hypothetical protein [Parasphingorhabdus litoris]
MNEHVIECVIFRLTEGTDQAAFHEKANLMSEWVKEQPGFVARNLSCTEEGEWIEHIEWTSMEAAKAAANLIGKDEKSRPFVSVIDGPSVSMRHAALKITA